MLGREPEIQVREDLRRFKSLMEAGEIPTVVGQPSGRRSSLVRVMRSTKEPEATQRVRKGSRAGATGKTHAAIYRNGKWRCSMKALCWFGKHDVRVETVPDPVILNPHDCIVKITRTAICGSDLHLFDGYIPTMEQGDILGHEFMGEIVELVQR